VSPYYRGPGTRLSQLIPKSLTINLVNEALTKAGKTTRIANQPSQHPVLHVDWLLLVCCA
jgi:hypothetical protein